MPKSRPGVGASEVCAEENGRWWWGVEDGGGEWKWKWGEEGGSREWRDNGEWGLVRW